MFGLERSILIDIFICLFVGGCDCASVSCLCLLLFASSFNASERIARDCGNIYAYHIAPDKTIIEAMAHKCYVIL